MMASWASAYLQAPLLKKKAKEEVSSEKPKDEKKESSMLYFQQ